MGAPTHRKGRYFWTRKLATQEMNIVYWKPGKAGAEQVLFDPNTWSTDGSTSLKGWWPSRDGKLVAYNKSEHNADETVMYLRDVDSGKDLPDVIAGTKYSGASWTPDGKGFYYTWVPPIGGKVTIADRPGFAEVRYHAVGTDPASDKIVHPATGILLFLCWPLALIALIAYPIVWVVLIPFRIVGIAVGGVLELIGRIITLPVRLMRRAA